MIFTEGLGQNHVLGPEVPYIFKIRNLFLNEIHIKLDREHTSLKSAKLFIADVITQVTLKKEYKGLRVVADVDPM